MAQASWAHISEYWASVAAIAGVFWPKKLVAISVINKARLAAITGGGTLAANATSYAAAAASAWMAVSSAWSAVVLIHATYGAAAAAIAADAGPYHAWLVNSESTELEPSAVARNSAASPCQADAAANMGPAPTPEYMRPELI